MLTGKNALVTGASRGIGRQIALTLAAAHAFVIVNYNGSREKADAVVAEIKAAGGDAVSYQCNVSDFDECQNMITALIKEYKHIDILVNNAGITRDGLMARMSEEQYDMVVAVNQKSVFNMSKFVGSVMTQCLTQTLRVRSTQSVTCHAIS